MHDDHTEAPPSATPAIAEEPTERDRIVAASHLAYEEEQLLTEFTADFKKLTRSKATIALELSPIEAWCILAQLQLALRHPENSPGDQHPSAHVAQAIAMRLQLEVATTPALKRVAAAGWSNVR